MTKAAMKTKNKNNNKNNNNKNKNKNNRLSLRPRVLAVKRGSSCPRRRRRRKGREGREGGRPLASAMECSTLAR